MNKSYSEALIVPNADDIELLSKHDTCDKYDYLTAVACGAIGGMIDIFLVGAPGKSVLGKWTDQQVDNAVMAFAKKWVGILLLRTLIMLKV